MTKSRNTTNERENLVQRMLIALDTSERSLAMLDPATSLAQRLSIGLDALFIEEDDFFAWAALPFARALDVASGEARRVDTATMEKALKADAERLRSKLTSTATAKNVKVNFNVVRGRYFSAALAASAEQQADLLLLCHTASASFRIRTAPAVDSGPIVMSYSGSPQARRALSLAAELAREQSAPLKIWIVEPELEKTLRDELKTLGVTRFSVHRATTADFASLIDAVVREPCSTLVLPRELVNERENQASFAKLNCPLFLVS